WRFLDQKFVMDVNNPFPVEEEVNVYGLKGSVKDANLTAVKIGDVSGDANPANGQGIKPRSLGEFRLNLEDQQIKRGQIVEVPFYAQEDTDLEGFQLALDGYGVKFLGIT